VVVGCGSRRLIAPLMRDGAKAAQSAARMLRPHVVGEEGGMRLGGRRAATPESVAHARPAWSSQHDCCGRVRGRVGACGQQARPRVSVPSTLVGRWCELQCSRAKSCSQGRARPPQRARSNERGRASAQRRSRRHGVEHEEARADQDGGEPASARTRCRDLAGAGKAHARVANPLRARSV